MSQQASPLTYESILELFRRSDERMAKTERIVEATNKAVGSLGSRVGQIVENMIYGDIVAQCR